MPNYNKAIIVGDACLDINIRLNDFLNNDATSQMPYDDHCGGTSANTALVLSKLGIDTSFLGTIGDDYAGRFILDELQRNNIDTSLTIVDKSLNTVNVICLIEDNGERHLWGYPRVNVANGELDISRIDIEKIKTASWFHCSGMTMLNNGNIKNVLPDLYKIAHEAGVPTSFDFNTRVARKELLDENAYAAIEKILPYVDYLTGSALDEFICFYPADDYRDSARYFAKNSKCVIARLGSQGAFVVSGDKEELIKSYDVEVINATGAGDSFNAGFIAGKLTGLDDFKATQYASAVAAFKISHDSSYNLDKETINQFINNNK